MRLSIVLCLPWLATVICAPLQGRATELPDLYEATFDELAAGLEAGDFTSVDLVKAYFARIEEVDYQGPFLRSVIQTSPVALEQAAYCDELRKNGVNL
jgi:amidase